MPNYKSNNISKEKIKSFLHMSLIFNPNVNTRQLSTEIYELNQIFLKKLPLLPPNNEKKMSSSASLPPRNPTRF